MEKGSRSGSIRWRSHSMKVEVKCNQSYPCTFPQIIDETFFFQKLPFGNAGLYLKFFQRRK